MRINPREFIEDRRALIKATMTKVNDDCIKAMKKFALVNSTNGIYYLDNVVPAVHNGELVYIHAIEAYRNDLRYLYQSATDESNRSIDSASLFDVHHIDVFDEMYRTFYHLPKKDIKGIEKRPTPFVAEWEKLRNVANEELMKYNAMLSVYEDEDGCYSLDIIFGLDFNAKPFDITKYKECETYAVNYYENELTNLVNEAWHYALNKVTT